jgi:mannose-6-phosphate isomerase-like protein (cupin superfamily)
MHINNRNTVPEFIAPDLAIIRELAASRNSPSRQMSLAEATILPGGRVTEHYHKVLEEFYYVTEGSGLMTLDGETQRVVAGDTIVIRPGQRHKFYNDSSNEKVVLLVCCAPEWTVEDQVLTE